MFHPQYQKAESILVPNASPPIKNMEPRANQVLSRALILLLKQKNKQTNPKNKIPQHLAVSFQTTVLRMGCDSPHVHLGRGL